VTNQDEITRVLRDCEERLRGLASEGRLTSDALNAFVRLAATVTDALERRRDGNRGVTTGTSAAHRRAGDGRGRELGNAPHHVEARAAASTDSDGREGR
jgi:hypothetical protein